MKKLMKLLKFLAKEMIDVKFNTIKGKGSKVFTSKGTEEDTRRIGNFIEVKENSVIFRHAPGVMDFHEHYVFAGKGTHDIKIKLDDIDINSIRFTLLEDDGKYLEFAAIAPETKSKERKKLSFLK